MSAKWHLLVPSAIAMAILACSIAEIEQGNPAEVTEVASDESPAPESFSLVIPRPRQGDLVDLLAAHAERAAALERRPFVEFSATWCPSCILLERSLDDERMIEAFRGTYIIRLDLDEWEGRLSRTGFIVLGVPAFFEIDAAGRPTGRTITGAAWGPDLVENIAPVMQEFFRAEG